MSDYLIQYREAIRRGEIVAGYELITELNNLIRDLDNPRYIYDTTDAEERIDFMEHCIRLTKSPFYNKPMKLMLWQKAFIEASFSFKMADKYYTNAAGIKKNVDRFKKIILLIARKNTKSETCSALELTLPANRSSLNSAYMIVEKSHEGITSEYAVSTSDVAWKSS